jgi:hypothetical protein
MARNNDLNEAKGKFSIFGIKMNFQGTSGAKLVVGGVMTILYLYYNFYTNHITFFLSSLAYLFAIFVFAFLWKFGCSVSSLECDYLDK